MVPPIGAYKTRFDHLDPKVGVPLYGTHDTWGGDLKKQAKKIRDRDFKAKVKPCSRLDRTLVYVRNNVFESLKSQAASKPSTHDLEDHSRFDMASVEDSIMNRTVQTSD